MLERVVRSVLNQKMKAGSGRPRSTTEDRSRRLREPAQLVDERRRIEWCSIWKLPVANVICRTPVIERPPVESSRRAEQNWRIEQGCRAWSSEAQRRARCRPGCRQRRLCLPVPRYRERHGYRNAGQLRRIQKEIGTIDQRARWHRERLPRSPRGYQRRNVNAVPHGTAAPGQRDAPQRAVQPRHAGAGFAINTHRIDESPISGVVFGMDLHGQMKRLGRIGQTHSDHCDIELCGIEGQLVCDRRLWCRAHRRAPRPHTWPHCSVASQRIHGIEPRRTTGRDIRGR